MTRWGKPRAPLGGAHFDVIVIGGGINGVAIARECARAGRSTLLVEQHDFGAGTTSRSTRIIHGGLRYLEHGEIGLVRESLRERQRLLRERWHLVRPMDFLLALDQNGSHNALEVRFALWLYRRFAGGCLSQHPRDLARFERQLDSGCGWSLFPYEDAQCEFPERLVAEWLREAIAAGAVARNHAEVLAVETAHGRVRGVVLRDVMTSAECRVTAAALVNATGPWADRLCRGSGIHTPRPMVGGLRGSHIVLPRFAGAPHTAIYAEALDGRPIFIIPWNAQLLVGTTEIPDNSDPAATQASEAEIEYLFDSFVRLFPHAPVAVQDVRWSFAGVRPLPFAPAQKPSAVTRRHILHVHAVDGAAGMISVIGGKLTTAASLARMCARKLGIRVEEPRATQIAGPIANQIEAMIRDHSRHLANASGLAEPQARALLEWHGRHAEGIAQLARKDAVLREPLCPHTSHVVAEAVAAVEYECAVSLADIFLRRVPVALGPCWSEECGQAAAQRVGAALGWTERQTACELEAFELERSQFLRAPQRAATRLRLPHSDFGKRAA